MSVIAARRLPAECSRTAGASAAKPVEVASTVTIDANHSRFIQSFLLRVGIIGIGIKQLLSIDFVVSNILLPDGRN
jgi:hypothetical protein